MLTNYLPILFLFFLAAGIGTAMMVGGSLVRPKNQYAEKNSAYECGIDPVGDAMERVKPRYYVYAMIFLAFDVEAVFLFSWAIVFERLGFFALVEMFLFILILILGLLYAWYKGALQWGN
ncbi:MAG: NADH-quinone oxidoreductase subunit A [Candidatus Schekmanbacteria bacterium]|nr:NADH-quinone oxidoreductase subunit A [Candidatus Schekmanbacteria bacterium]